MSDEDLCTYVVDEGVAVLTFNRPDSMNGMTGNMEVAYFERLRQAEVDADVRAIVVTGAGRAFCPGADLAHRPGPDDEPLPNASIPRTTPLEITKPMIAAINGACAGVGFAYALQCDLRFAAAGAKFTTAFARRGLIAEYGMAWLLQAIAGRQVALDLLLSARVVLAEEAHDLGLVSRVVDPGELTDVVMAYARDLAANASPASMATIKFQVNTEPSMNAAEALHHAEALMRESLAGTDVSEGIASFLEKRQVTFPSLGTGTRFAWMSPLDEADGHPTH
ncbi:MAG: enoyl-CoA hydratase-related protein [Ilumatobacter sp.]|uniref:enoyl-CoA hydratase-related protein n=1 Tax=Ilumatobacter sp. TaxID=1967498 RepID=UPI0032983BF3